MLTIHKYQLQGRTEIEMPDCALVLSAQLQKGIPCIWALVDTEKPMEKRTFEMFGTGQPIDPKPDMVFIGTFQDGPLVWHVAEILPSEDYSCGRNYLKASSS